VATYHIDFTDMVHGYVESSQFHHPCSKNLVKNDIHVEQHNNMPIFRDRRYCHIGIIIVDTLM
jgi:hypothetical protein